MKSRKFEPLIEYRKFTKKETRKFATKDGKRRMNADTRTSQEQAMREKKMQCIQINTSEDTSEKRIEFIVKLPHLVFKVSHSVTFSESHFFPLVAPTEK